MSEDATPDVWCDEHAKTEAVDKMQDVSRTTSAQPRDCVTVDGFRVYLNPVTSSNVAAVGHCPLIGAGVMVVRFVGGATYVYRNVPPVVHAEMMQAPSIGKFLHLRVVGTQEYPFEKFEQTKRKWPIAGASAQPCGCDAGVPYICERH